MLALLVAVVLSVGVMPSLGGVVGVLPGSTTVVGTGVVHGASAPHVGIVPGGVVTGGVVPGGAGVTTTVVKSTGPLPAIPQYARTFGTFSGTLNGYVRDQWENRDGSYVRGGYTMVDVEGALVVVEYSSDPISGFKVVVKRRGYPDYYLDSVYLGGPLPGGYLPPFYSDFGYDYSDDYYGYDFDSYYSGLGYDHIPTYYDSYDYDTYAPGYLDTYDYDSDYDYDYRRRRAAIRV